MVKSHNNLGAGRHRIMDLPRATYAVYLSDSDALRYEADKLDMVLNRNDVYACGHIENVNFYSIRSCDGAPHVLLKVANDAVQWCRGMGATRPAQYMRQVVTFIVKKRFGIDADMACTGIVRQKGRYYNVYDLPRGFIYYGNMDLSNAGLSKLPDMRTVTIKGDYDISGNSLLSFTGVPHEIFGDFYFYDNAFRYELSGRPAYCNIHGEFHSGYHGKLR